jgi:hypothetical protein
MILNGSAFVLSKPFQPSLTFAGKAMNLLKSGTAERDKCSSFFQLCQLQRKKSYVTSTPGANVIKLFHFIADIEAK